MKQDFVLKDLPRHPLRKENRWDAIQHSASVPKTMVTEVPMRRQSISDLMTPERQESISSSQLSLPKKPDSLSSCYSSSYSSTNGSAVSSRYSPRKQARNESALNLPPLPTRLDSFSISVSSSVASSPKQQGPSTNSLFSRTSLENALEEKDEVGDTRYWDYTVSLRDYIEPQNRAAKKTSIKRIDEWFQHSDSSTSTDTYSSIEDEDRSMIPVVYNSREDIDPADEEITEKFPHKVGKSDDTTKKDGSRMGAPRLSFSGQSCSTAASGDRIVSSDSTSNKLDLLRERVKQLREQAQRQIKQGRYDLQRTRSFRFQGTMAQHMPKKIEPTQAHTQNLSNALRKLKERSAPLKPCSSSLVAHASSHKPAKKKKKPVNTVASRKLSSRSRRKKKPSSLGSSEVAVKLSPEHCERESKEPISDLSTEQRTEVPPLEKSLANLTAYYSLSSDSSCSSWSSSERTSIAEDAANSLKAERKYDKHIHILRRRDSTEQSPEIVRKESAKKLQMFQNFTVSDYSERLALMAEIEKLSSSRMPFRRSMARSISTPSSSRSRAAFMTEIETLANLANPNSKLEHEIYSPGTSKNNTTPKKKPKNLIHELTDALAARSRTTSTLESIQRSWSNSVNADSVTPLASEDALSSPAFRTPPTLFQERRIAYLNKCGDSTESRTQAPFTTANWVLGSLPKNKLAPPLHDVRSPIVKDTDGHLEINVLLLQDDSSTKEDNAMKYDLNKWMFSKNAEKDAKISPTAPKQRSSRKPVLRDVENKEQCSRQMAPLRESDRSDRARGNWAQRSFVNKFPFTSKEKYVAKKSSSGQFSSRKLSEDTNDHVTQKAPIRRFAARESSKETKDVKNTSSRRLIRKASGLSKDNFDTVKSSRNGVKRSTSRRVLRNASDSSRDESKKSASRSILSNSSSSSRDELKPRDESKKSISRRVIRKHSSSSRDGSKNSISCSSLTKTEKPTFTSLSRINNRSSKENNRTNSSSSLRFLRSSRNSSNEKKDNMLVQSNRSMRNFMNRFKVPTSEDSGNAKPASSMRSVYKLSRKKKDLDRNPSPSKFCREDKRDGSYRNNSSQKIPHSPRSVSGSPRDESQKSYTDIYTGSYHNNKDCRHEISPARHSR